MRAEGRPIYFGVNFIFTPQPAVDKMKNLDFQRALLDGGIDTVQAQFQNQRLVIATGEQGALQITVGTPGPQIGQLLLAATNVTYSLDLFLKHAEAVAAAFDKVWKGPRQIIGRDATIQKLFESTKAHAFQELWEDRLGQSAESIKALDRPVLGGGLRFVMPPKAGESEPVIVEVKIESFFQDAKKIFVETQMKWPQPTQAGITFDVRARLTQVDTYLEQNVLSFISRGKP